MTTATLEWDGKEYELKYKFSIVRRIRAEGVNIPRIYRAISVDNESAIDYGDDIAYIVAWLLREAGAGHVTDEDVWRHCMVSQENLKTVMALFSWVCLQHFAQSPNAPAPAKKAPAKKKAAARKPRTR